MVMVNNILLHTGAGNPSPVYDPELSRFDGWSRRAPTLVRGIPRGRELEHPAHTPARPLEGRHVPTMEQYQIPAFPQIVCFDVFVADPGTEIHTSPPLATPSIITEFTLFHFIATQVASLQIALASELITTDAQLAACPLILKMGPENLTWPAPLHTEMVGTSFPIYKYPLNIPIPNGPRNRIAVRVWNTNPSGPIQVRLQFHIQPL